MKGKSNKIQREQSGKFLLSEECAKHAETFMKAVVKAKSPMEVADLFYENSYLKADLNGSAKIFYNALDLTVKGDFALLNLLMNENLLSDIYTLAFMDYAKKNNLIKQETADKLSKYLVNFK